MARLNVKGITKVSPAGLGQWVKVGTPDDFGKFTANLVCNPSDPAVVEFKTIIDDLVNKVQQETGAKKVNTPYIEDDEGNIVFKTSVKAVDNDGNPNKVDLVDAHKNDISGTIVGNGSKIKVLAYLMPYDQGANKGVTLRLKKVQVIDLVEYSEDFGEEDGYTASTPKPQTNAATEDLVDDEDF